MKRKSRVIYTMSTAVLYSLLKLAWNLYLTYWKNFATLSDVYTEEYGQNQLEAIEAAQALPDNTKRQGSRQSTRNKLRKTSKTATIVWKQLKGFIIKSYSSADDQQTALKQAGISHYDKAANSNFSEVSLLLSDGFTFVTNHASDLVKGGMPDRFIEAFATAKKAFDDQQALYGKAKGTATDGTTDKITANNTLFRTLKFMLADAATIFIEQSDIQQQFTLIALTRLITTDGISGIHFSVTNSQNNLPLQTAIISIVGFPEPFTVNKRGVLDIKLPKDTYYFTVSVPGYPVYQGKVLLDANVMRRATVELKTSVSSEATS